MHGNPSVFSVEEGCGAACRFCWDECRAGCGEEFGVGGLRGSKGRTWEGRAEGERPSHNSTFQVWAQPLNLAGPAQSSLPLPPRKGVFWLLDENRNAFFSTFLGHNWSLFYLYCREDPSWPCSAECLAALWIPLFNCHLFRLWDP